MADGEATCRRIRRQTTFFGGDTARVLTRGQAEKRISIDVGERPTNLKSAMRKVSISSSSVTQAKKVSEKYAKNREKEIKFSQTCRIRVVTPLPGWDEQKLRIPDDSTTSHSLFNNLEISPESKKKLLSVSDDNDTDSDVQIEFGATFVFNGPIDDIVPDKKTKTTTRRKSIAVQRKEVLKPVEINVKDQESENGGGGDSTVEDKVPENSGQKRRRRSLFASKTMDLSSTPPDENKPAGPKKIQRKGRKSMVQTAPATQAPSNDDMEKQPEKVHRQVMQQGPIAAPGFILLEDPNSTNPTNVVLSLDRTHKGGQQCIAKDTVVRQTRVVDWLTKTESPILNDTLEREGQEFEVAAADRSRKRKARKEETVGPTSSPEIIEIVHVKRAPKITAPHTFKNRANSDNEDEQSFKPLVVPHPDMAPVPLVHHMSPIRLEGEDERVWPTTHFLVKDTNRVDMTTLAPFPPSEPVPPATFIQLRQVEEAYACQLLFNHPKEWIDIFGGRDSSTLWTDAFCPRISSNWLGDAEVIRRARTFVQKWKTRLTKEDLLEKKDGRRTRKDSDSDYEDNDISHANPLIICGPSGSGKSTLISSLAAEFGLNILEVQPGDRRNAAALRQKLDGATKNQMMQQKGAISSFFATKAAPPQEVNRTHNLIVVEHADLTFEEDKDFWPTIKAIATDSRVPIIWTCEGFPAAEIYREPELTSFERLDLERNPVGIIAQYLQCCLLVTKNLFCETADMEKYVAHFNCDLRKLLLDLQLQTSDGDLLLLLAASVKPPSPLASDKETTHRSRQDLADEKREQYSHILNSLELTERPSSASEQLLDAAVALGDRLPQSRLATDYLPYLVQMDHVEAAKSKKSRRYMHYFSEVRAEVQIDRNGSLIPVVRRSSLMKDD